MSFTSNPSSHHAPTLPHRVSHAQGGGASSRAWLWAAAFVVLLAVPAGWWARHNDVSNAAETHVTPAMSRQILPTSDGPRAVTMIAHQPVRAPIDSVQAQPLPGNPMPSIPASLARSGIEGSRTARMQLDVQGKVSEVTIVDRSGSEDPRLDAAVIESLRQWRFEPATRDGHAVVSSVQVPVDFNSEL
ncbi:MULTISPECIES: energy transducer TonB [unclassified Xanthomonas]|uniref:energy transducer TonB n=1 Tax=unclassified Xanthomonas TaxID=2643310 RepID=UPI0016209ACD|nr:MULTISPECIES: energy transducer TonB [unclassified Xanthomonas]MBB4129627.1 protein TonB [Xanthomonas sp. 3075]MBB5862428.1 protein TonB [Xanthomonas sp. 3058]